MSSQDEAFPAITQRGISMLFVLKAANSTVVKSMTGYENELKRTLTVKIGAIRIGVIAQAKQDSDQLELEVGGAQYELSDTLRRKA